MKKYAMILCALLVGGCATEGPRITRIPDGANLAVTRSSQFVAGGVDFVLVVDNNDPQIIERGRTILLTLPKGPHILRATAKTCGPLCSEFAGNSGGYPIDIGDKVVRLDLVIDRTGQLWNPFNFFPQLELNFKPAK